MTADRDMIAAEFALGALEADERAAVARRAADDVALRLAIEEWETRLAPMALTIPPEGPPAGLFERITARIDAGAGEPRGARTVRSREGAWRDEAPGLRMKILHRNADTRRQTILLKLAPGAIYAGHDHDHEEEMFILEGDLVFGDFELHAGDYHRAAPGGAHPAAHSRTGCAALLITSF